MAQWDVPTSTLPPQIPRWSIPGYSHEQFIEDLLGEDETEIRRCLKKGANKLRLDYIEEWLAVKIDPTWNNSFIDLNTWQPDGVTWLP
jgi:5-methyltetrahydropteroyltriglutamate--homocysteine methyltransferase